MTEVLSISAQLNGSSLFETHPLRRSSSQTSFLLQSPTTYSTPSTDNQIRYTNARRETRVSASLPSSAPSSPRLTSNLSSQSSYISTLSSAPSLDQQCGTDEEELVFPSYSNDQHDLKDTQSELEQSSGPRSIGSNAITPSASDNSLQSRPFRDTLGFRTKAGDDTAVKVEPTKHVDYLSHNWNEEDVWSTWRHIVAKRKAYANACRLENASWRSWTKCKYRLGTIVPEKLNWMKDHDVTWLYGPLQTSSIKDFEFEFTPSASRLFRSNSFTSKKPILKKRTLSELMLQRSISSSTLMKQATDSVRAQQREEHVNDRVAVSEEKPSSSVQSQQNPEPPCLKLSTTLPPPIPFTSASTSGAQTPSTKRHIHFNNKVEQCIAINKCSVHDNYFRADYEEDSSSDDDMLMMKPMPGSGAKLSNRTTPRGSFSSESKTIAMLPSTTLNYRGDTPDFDKQKPQSTSSLWHVPSKTALSKSQETLNAMTTPIGTLLQAVEDSKSTTTKPPSDFLLDDEDEDMDMNWEPLAHRRESAYVHDQKDTRKDLSDGGGAALRQTPSGMFMPFEGSEIDMTSSIVGKFYSTVNTAKDIVHIIWNVGWRK